MKYSKQPTLVAAALLAFAGVRGVPTKPAMDDATRALKLRKIMGELEQEGILIVPDDGDYEMAQAAQMSTLPNYDPTKPARARQVVTLSGGFDEDEVHERVIEASKPRLDAESKKSAVRKQIEDALQNFFMHPQLEPRNLHDFLFVDRHLDIPALQGWKFHTTNNGGIGTQMYTMNYLPGNVVVEDGMTGNDGSKIELRPLAGVPGVQYYLEHMGSSLLMQDNYLEYSFFFKDFHYANLIMESVLDLSILLPSGFMYPSNPILIPANDPRSASFRTAYPDYQPPEEPEGPRANIEGMPFYPIGFTYKPLIFAKAKPRMCPFVYVGSDTKAGQYRPTLKQYLTSMGKSFTQYLDALREETFRILSTKQFAKNRLDFVHGMMTTDYVFPSLYGCRLSLVSLDGVAPYRYQITKADGEEKSIDHMQPQDIRVGSDEDAMTFVSSVYDFFQVLVGMEPYLAEYASEWTEVEKFGVLERLEQLGEFLFATTGRKIQVNLGTAGVFKYSPVQENIDNEFDSSSETILNRLSRAVGWSSAAATVTEPVAVTRPQPWRMDTDAETVLAHPYFEGLTVFDITA